MSEKVVTVRLVEEMNVTSLILHEYSKQVQAAIDAGQPLPPLPSDAVVPWAEDKVVGERTMIIKIRVAP